MKEWGHQSDGTCRCGVEVKSLIDENQKPKWECQVQINKQPINQPVFYPNPDVLSYPCIHIVLTQNSNSTNTLSSLYPRAHLNTSNLNLNLNLLLKSHQRTQNASRILKHTPHSRDIPCDRSYRYVTQKRKSILTLWDRSKSRGKR